MSEEFKPFVLRIDRPAESNLVRALLAHDACLYQRLARIYREEGMPVNAKGLLDAVAALGDSPGLDLRRSMPDGPGEYGFHHIKFVTPRKIGCRTITYTEDGAEFVNPAGEKYSLSEAQLEAMLDKVKSLGKGE